MSSSTFTALPNLDDPSIAPFWRAAAEGALKIPRCAACGAFNWYPVGACRHCGGETMNWVALSGRARLYSWTLVRRALDPALASLTPYVSIIAEPVDAPGVRIISRLVDVEPERLTADAPIRVVFRDLAYPNAVAGVMAPLFILDGGTTS